MSHSLFDNFLHRFYLAQFDQHHPQPVNIKGLDKLEITEVSPPPHPPPHRNYLFENNAYQV